MNQAIYTNQKGQGLVEYALLLTAVALTAVGILSLLGVQVSDVFCQVSEGVSGENICNSVLFFDDFGQDLENWYLFDNDDKNWKTTNGNDPELCYSGRGSNGVLANDSEGADYAISVKANASANKDYGVYFRASENENGQIDGYTFEYEPGHQGGQFVMRKWVNGYAIWPPVATAPVPREYRGQNAERHIEINVTGNRFTATIDGEEVLVGQDDTYAEGSAGLYVSDNGRACFDDFTVESH